MASPKSICVLRLSAIGDTCNAVSAVQAIQRQYPHASITWVIGRTEASLLRGLPGVEFVVFDKKEGSGAFRKLWRQLRGRRFDTLLSMQLAFRANLVSLCISATRRIGYDRSRSKELHSLFINERIRPAIGPHVVDTFMQFAEAIGVNATEPCWHIPVEPVDRQWACNTLAQEAERHLVIVPAASARERNWLPERYAALVDHAASKGFAVYLCGGPTALEIELASQVCKLSKSEPHNLVGCSNLKQLFALIEAVDLLVAPDTGPIHMAVAAGTPVIGLYAHSNPSRTGPYGYQKYVVDAYTDQLERQLGKSADQVRWGQRLKGEELMKHITVEQVCTMFDRVILEQEL